MFAVIVFRVTREVIIFANSKGVIISAVFLLIVAGEVITDLGS